MFAKFGVNSILVWVCCSSCVNGHHTDDRMCVDAILEQSNDSYITEMLADGGYDSHKIYEEL